MQTEYKVFEHWLQPHKFNKAPLTHASKGFKKHTSTGCIFPPRDRTKEMEYVGACLFIGTYHYEWKKRKSTIAMSARWVRHNCGGCTRPLHYIILYYLHYRIKLMYTIWWNGNELASRRYGETAYRNSILSGWELWKRICSVKVIDSFWNRMHVEKWKLKPH